MKQVCVGSRNSVKVEAVGNAFIQVWPQQPWNVTGFDVLSGVRDQPMSIEEAITGAYNRAKAALEGGNSDYGVGLEGGIYTVTVPSIGEIVHDTGWVVVIDKYGVFGVASGPHMVVPPRMLQLIKSGDELGVAVDKVMGMTNSKQSIGHFGVMTNQVITRKSGYTMGVVSALARFIRPELF